MSSDAPKEAPKFRARKLSVSDIDISEFGPGSSTESKGAGRQRRLSMSPEKGAKPAIALPFDISICGTNSNHGKEPGIRPGQSSSKINQDRGAVVYPMLDDPKKALFCVYDGHGAHGDKVSHYVMTNVLQKLEDNPVTKTDPKTALIDAFLSVDDDLKQQKKFDSDLSGTTAVVILMDDKDLYIANAGDSRAVVCKKVGSKFEAINLSEDQKPDNPEEQKRIEAAGGFVSPPEPQWGGPARVWVDANMTLPGLAMGRSIGDHMVGKVGVIARPEVEHYKLSEADQFIVLASDGVWEFISSPQACDIIQSVKGAGMGANKACERLIETSAAMWQEEEGDYSDDITAIVIYLPLLPCHSE